MCYLKKTKKKQKLYLNCISPAQGILIALIVYELNDQSIDHFSSLLIVEKKTFIVYYYLLLFIISFDNWSLIALQLNISITNFLVISSSIL